MECSAQAKIGGWEKQESSPKLVVFLSEFIWSDMLLHYCRFMV